MAIPVLEERRRARRRTLDTAAAYCTDLQGRDGVEMVRGVVVGSVARGDFSKWSDIDVLVIADELPGGTRARADLGVDERLPGVQGVLWTPTELGRRRARRDPIAVEADTVGVEVWPHRPGS